MCTMNRFKTSKTSKNTSTSSMQSRMKILKISVSNIWIYLTYLAINNGLIGHDIDERFNFKPIYAASSYIGGLDVTSIQNFEQTFFNDYSQLK